MTKWSNFILNLGTAGPSTFQGIRNLGFALVSDFPTILSKYLRVDAAQTFTSPEKQQGRENLGLGTMSTQGADTVAITGGSIAGITDLAIVDGGTGASSASVARTNLGLGNVDNTSDANKPVSTPQQTALNLKANLASPPLSGTPTAPTAAGGNNTTQIATTAFVTAALASVAAPDVKAWVNFNGTGTVAIRASKNVSSITDNGTGDYTVNFTTAMADANYAFTQMISGLTTNGAGYAANLRSDVAPTASALRFITGVQNSVPVDVSYVSIAVFR